MATMADRATGDGLRQHRGPSLRDPRGDPQLPRTSGLASPAGAPKMRTFLSYTNGASSRRNGGLIMF